MAGGAGDGARVRPRRLGNLAAVPVGILAAIAIFLALRPLANRLFLIQINNHWPYLCEFARGEATCFDAPIEACAQRVIAAVRANDADEIIVVGHSGGGALAPAVIVRALELDPDIGRKGPPLVLVTLGSIAPGAALHPRAARLRAVFARLAVEPSVLWIDSQSRADVLNFWNFDPVEGIGARVEGRRCNPLIWKVRFGDMLSRQFYWRIRFNFFRLHYQFIMASDRRAPYDYFLLVCGPVPVAAWARDPNGVLAAFAADGSLAASPLPGTVCAGSPRPRSRAERRTEAGPAAPQRCDRRSITACGIGAPFIVPLAGSPLTHTRVSKPSTASAPFLSRRWCTSKLERRRSVAVVSIVTSSPKRVGMRKRERAFTSGCPEKS